MFISKNPPIGDKIVLLKDVEAKLGTFTAGHVFLVLDAKVGENAYTEFNLVDSDGRPCSLRGSFTLGVDFVLG